MKRSSASPKTDAPRPQSAVTQRPTIIDVARAAGVSKATASKAMSLPPEVCPVRKETRERILDVAEKMGYRASWHAKALAHGKSHTVGLLYQGPYPWYLTGVYGDMIQALAVELQRNGFHLLFVPISEEDDTWSDMLHDRRIDGCVLADYVPERIEAILKEANLPTVLLNIQSDLPYSTIIPDDRNGAEQLTRHLLELGHRDIVFFQVAKGYVRTHFSYFERLEGYKSVLESAGLENHIQIIESSVDEFAQAMSTHLAGKNQKLLNRVPTAVMAYSHDEAIELMYALWQQNVIVPADMSLATFNDVYPLDLMTPPVTTVKVPASTMGWQAGVLLLEMIKAHSKSRKSKSVVTEEKPQHIVVPESLVVRASTAAPSR
jgi:DNA-binding LacI/PurR family transcriptional regulator